MNCDWTALWRVRRSDPETIIRNWLTVDNLYSFWRIKGFIGVSCHPFSYFRFHKWLDNCWPKFRKVMGKEINILTIDVQNSVGSFPAISFDTVHKGMWSDRCRENIGDIGPLLVRSASRTWRGEKCLVRAWVAFFIAIALLWVDSEVWSQKRPGCGIALQTASVGLIPSGPTESLTALTAIWSASTSEGLVTLFFEFTVCSSNEVAEGFYNAHWVCCFRGIDFVRIENISAFCWKDSAGNFFPASCAILSVGLVYTSIQHRRKVSQISLELTDGTQCPAL